MIEVVELAAYCNYLSKKEKRKRKKEKEGYASNPPTQQNQPNPTQHHRLVIVGWWVGILF